MTDAAAPGAPAAPSIAPPSPPDSPNAPTIKELVSQNAAKIPTQAALFATAKQHFPQATAADLQVASQVWTDTRKGQGLPTGDTPMPQPAPPATAVHPQAGQPVPGTAPAGVPPPPRATAPMPTPPPAAKPDPNALPQYTAPTPTAHYDAPTLESAKYTPAQYEPPKKGLQYLAAGLSLLFPGAPIASAAAGFAKGLQSGADDKYKRASTTAKDTYEAARDAAQTANAQKEEQAKAAFQNQQIVDQAAVDKAKAAFGNQKIAFDNSNRLREQGTNPATGKPFVYPDPKSLIKGPPSDAGLANAYSSLSKQAAANGDTFNANRFQSQVTEFTHRVDRASEDAERRKETQIQIDAETKRQNAGFAHEDQVESRREANAWAVAARRDPTQLKGLRDDADRRRKDFATAWNSATKVDPLTGTTGALTPDEQKNIAGYMRKIDASTDPAGLSQKLGEGTQNVTAQMLLQDYGSYRDALRRSQGAPIYAVPDVDTSATHAKANATIWNAAAKKAGLDPTNPQVKDWTTKAAAAGVNPSDPGVLDVMRHDLGHAAVAPPNQDPRAAAATAAGLRPGTPAYQHFMATSQAGAFNQPGYHPAATPNTYRDPAIASFGMPTQ